MSDKEQAARDIGWRPKEEFRGDPEKWVDAETFISRGEHYLPLIKADRDRLKGDVARLAAETAETKAALAAAQEAIEEFRRYHTEDTKRQVSAAKADLLKRLKEAREADDVEAEVEIQDKLDDIRTAQRATPAPSPAPSPAPTTDPVTAAWIAENPWFSASPSLRGMALGFAEELRGDPSTKHLVGRPLLDEIAARMKRFLPEEPRRPSKVDGGRPQGGGGSAPAGGVGRSYADLPAEAKAACESFTPKLVGPNRAFKDKAAWQAHYAEQFFAGETA